MKKLETLKNCPFCNCNATLKYSNFMSCMDIEYESYEIKARHKIGCPIKQVRQEHELVYKTEKQALKAWNRRK
jgi:hypothetical protein